MTHRGQKSHLPIEKYFLEIQTYIFMSIYKDIFFPESRTPGCFKYCKSELTSYLQLKILPYSSLVSNRGLPNTQEKTSSIHLAKMLISCKNPRRRVWPSDWLITTLSLKTSKNQMGKKRLPIMWLLLTSFPITSLLCTKERKRRRKVG